ncbi:hypothetical protein Tco_1315777 [Tanacetum coccineum]
MELEQKSCARMVYGELGKNIKDGPLDELSDWAKAKIRKRMQKSLNWVVVGIVVGRVYEVDDRRRIQTVELCNDCHRLAKGWFMRIALKGTYQELVYPVGEVSSWQIPNYLPVVKPPHMDKQPSGRPKSTKRIRSIKGVTLQDKMWKLILYSITVNKFFRKENYPKEATATYDYLQSNQVGGPFDAVNIG